MFESTFSEAKGFQHELGKKRHRIKNVFNTLRFLYDPLLLQRNVWAFIIKTSSFSIASNASKKKIFSVYGKGLMEVLNI